LPQQKACPDCGGELKHLGEDASEILEYVPERVEVIRQVRPKLGCAGCDRIIQALAPSRPIQRSIAGPGLLAHVLVAKYSDNLPRYRQSEIYAREGMEIDRSTLAEWVGGTSRLLAPLVESLRAHVMSGDKLHADHTPVPALAPGLGKTKTGRLWSYVRDDRPAGDKTPPAVWFCYSADRKGEHPSSTCVASEEHCRPMDMQGSIRFTKRGGSKKRRAGRMCQGSFAISSLLISLWSQPKHWNGSEHCLRSKNRSSDARLQNGAESASYTVGRCSQR